MASQHLSRREVEELRPSLDKVIYRCLGYSDSSILSTASSCLTNGYDRRKITDKLSAVIDAKKAGRLTEKILQLAEEVLSSQKTSSSKKRTHEAPDSHRESKKSKNSTECKPVPKDKSISNGSSVPTEPKPAKPKEVIKDENSEGQTAALSADRIRMMMVNAQKEIEERKKSLNALKGDENKSVNPNLAAVNAAKAAAAQIKTQITSNTTAAMPPPGIIKPVLYSQPTTTVFSREDYEKQKRMAELQAKIQSKLSGLGAVSGEKPRPLILDRDGRTVDVTGRQVQLTQVLPTLKANIRAKKREELKAQLGTKGGAEQEEAAWFDPRVAMRPSQRTKRALRFHEPGKFQQLADRIRMKAQLEKLQSEISQIARKTGISSATKLALLAPDTSDASEIPDMEWWDTVILMTPEEREATNAKRKTEGASLIKEIDLNNIVNNLKFEAISNLVEHPTQLRPPNESNKPVYMPVFLTKRERKKLRRQTRREAWKEEQEKVRLGLEAPAEPKLRISNLMRVLGSEAVQDPTKIEAHVREQMAKRKKAHEEANAARRLTHEQRSERRATKLKEDTSTGVHVAVYRIKDLFETAAKKFKVEKNAQQLFMTGCVILHRGCCVVITEGGPKQHNKYKKLMLRRIKWEEDTVKDNDGNAIPNSCQLVWEGITKQRSFGEVRFKVCPTERAAREHLSKHRATHYWDLAYSGSVLDQE